MDYRVSKLLHISHILQNKLEAVICMTVRDQASRESDT